MGNPAPVLTYHPFLLFDSRVVPWTYGSFRYRMWGLIFFLVVVRRLGFCAVLGGLVVERPLSIFLEWSGVTVFIEGAPGARHGLGNGGSGGLYGMGLVCWGMVGL